jgi:alpha-tubulin suppressor-like RCC1 family protein
VAISAGEYHSLALRWDNSIIGWGDNSDGQISVPWPLKYPIAMAGGDYHSVALHWDGTVTSWGLTDRLGSTPMPAALRGVVAVDAKSQHSLALVGHGPPFITSFLPAAASRWEGPRHYE